MYSLTVILLLALSTFAYKRESDGYITIVKSCSLWPWEKPCILTSLEYPAKSPPKVRQVWKQTAVSFPDDRTAIKLACSDFRLPKGRNGICERFKNLLLIENNYGTIEKFCGDKAPFEWVTNDKVIKIYLTQDKNPGFMNCSVRTILVDKKGREIPSPTPPFPTFPPYQEWESKEVDSEEHGVAKGPRPTSCKCGWANKVTSRIVNGTEANINEFPFAAAVIFKPSGQLICGASIITERHVISAAHCTARYRNLAILVGEHRLYDKSETRHTVQIDVHQIVDHPEYVRRTLHNDITILYLAKDITFNQFVGPVCMPTGPLDLEMQYVKIIGWGDLKYKGMHSMVINKVDVRVVPPYQCAKSYFLHVPKNNSQICVYGKKKSACQGDSGGPVIWLDPETNRYTLIGAVSFGQICGDEHPRVNTRVTYYLDWINKQIKASGLATCTKM